MINGMKKKIKNILTIRETESKKLLPKIINNYYEI